MKRAVKIIINAALGFVALILFNILGGGLGMSIGLNALNSCVVGVLGVSGFALLLVLKSLSR